jgi:hypothetical protein
MQVKATKALIGKTVVVHQIGQDPAEAIVIAVNEITGLITRVKLLNGLELVIDVTQTVVRLINPIREIVIWIKSLFRRKTA